jgi:hypothetical protein
MSCIENTIETLKKKYEQKYGFAVFALEIKENRDRIIIGGEVLTENQRHEVIAAMAKACDKKVLDEIKILSDKDGETFGWAVVKSGLADLKGRFVPKRVTNEKILRRIRSSQASKGEILRVILPKEDQLLVQSGDMTMGWIDRRDVTLKKSSMRSEWMKGKSALEDKMITVKGTGSEIIQEAEKYLGVKYILGANSKKAIDCSGLVQSVYRDAFGIILPRHSWDQKKIGKSVAVEKAVSGDLVFMINEKKGTKHVGIWEGSKSGGNIIHASLSEGEVVRQKMEEVLVKYELVDVRRITKKITPHDYAKRKRF